MLKFHGNINAALVLILFLLHGAAAVGTSAPEPRSANHPWPERPNILCLVAEDLGLQIPPFGDGTVETPALSRLAAEGVRYTHVFSPSGVCSPSRAALAMGMYPSHIGAQHMRTGPWYKTDVSDEDLAADTQKFGRAPYEALPPTEAKMHSEYLRLAGYYTSNNAKEDYQFRKPIEELFDTEADPHELNNLAGDPRCPMTTPYASVPRP